MTSQGDVRLEQLDAGDGQEHGGGRHLRLVAALALLGLSAAYLLYGADRHAAANRPAVEATGSALTGPLPTGPAAAPAGAGDADRSAGAQVQALLLRGPADGRGAGAAASGGTLVRYGADGVIADRALNGFAASLVPGVPLAPFPLGAGRDGLLVGLWQRDRTRAAVVDGTLRADPVPLREPSDGGGLSVLGAGPEGIWTVAGAVGPAEAPAWRVQFRATAASAPRDVPQPLDLADLAVDGADYTVLGLLRAPGTRDEGVLVSVSQPGRSGVELRAEWPDGRATRARVGALVALGPDYALVADVSCPGRGCGLSVVRFAESGAVARQAVRPPPGWTYQDGAQDGGIAFTADGFVLPVTAGSAGTRALAWIPARGGTATLVPGSAGLAHRTDGHVVAATGSTVVFSVTVPGTGMIRLAWWDARAAGPAHFLGAAQPDAELLAALLP